MPPATPLHDGPTAPNRRRAARWSVAVGLAVLVAGCAPGADGVDVVATDASAPEGTVSTPTASAAGTSTATAGPSDALATAASFWGAAAAGDRDGALALVDPSAAGTAAVTLYGRGDTLATQFDWYEAVGWEWVLEECVGQGTGPVDCTAAARNDWSEALGVEPVEGRFLVTVGDEGVVAVGERLDAFGQAWSTQVFEVFAGWVQENHPEDAAVMFDFRDPLDAAMLELYATNTERFVAAQQDG